MTRQAPGDGSEHVRGSVWLLAGALALVAVAILLLLRPLLASRRPSGGADGSAAAAANPARRDEPRHAGPVPTAADARRARPVPRPAAPPPSAPEAVAAAPAAGEGSAPPSDADGDAEPSGIALFPPPGTNPPKPGLIVPDDFVLPPGYVRHHQVTDDGQPLPPILMFHPDYDWVDAQGRPIELPADHVVPPDLAPPGLPLQMLEVPDARVEVVEPPPPGAAFEPADPP